MVITLSGDDDALVSRRFRALLEEHVPGDLADLNLSELDGAALTLPELRAATDALPFLGERRVVVVRGLVTRQGGKEGEDGEGGAKGQTAALAKELKAYLPQVPASTVLIFVERRKLGASALANALKAGSTVEESNLPTGDALPRYVAARARERGVRLPGDAAALLAQAVAGDPRRLDPELEKLALYAGMGGEVSARDVRALVHVPIEIAVWDLTDALFARDARAAVRALRALVEQDQPLQQVMGAVASQLRNLVVADEHRGGSPDALARATGLKPFVARKALGALRAFRRGEPQALLASLAALDLAYKTGKAELGSAMELWVVEVCSRRT